jgi:hypothetical protein
MPLNSPTPDVVATGGAGVGQLFESKTPARVSSPAGVMCCASGVLGVELADDAVDNEQRIGQHPNGELAPGVSARVPHAEIIDHTEGRRP